MFARNAKAILDREEMKRPKLVSGKRISDGTADRVLKSERGQNVTLDTLEKWAAKLKTPAWQLLHPNFDATSPLVTMDEDDLELEVVRRVKEKLEPFVKMYGGLDEESRPDGRSPGKPFGDLKAPAGESNDNAEAREPEGRPPASEKKGRQR